MNDRVASCIVVGKSAGKYYITIAANGGSVVTFEASSAVYHAMILRVAEQQLSDARESFRLQMDGDM